MLNKIIDFLKKTLTVSIDVIVFVVGFIFKAIKKFFGFVFGVLK